MIFVTVGAQLPFDRLLKAIDSWAARKPAGTEIIAQTGPSRLALRNITCRDFVPPAEFRALVERADLVVAHAGMGSILSALEMGKRIIVMPRRADAGEHRNDHQVATARHLAERCGVTVARDESELIVLLDDPSRIATPKAISPVAGADLLGAIGNFLNKEALRRGFESRGWQGIGTIGRVDH